MKKITVVIPIYDGLHEIKACLNSLMNSSNKIDIEVLLVNDNPNNQSIERLLVFFQNKYENIKVIKNRKNMGFSYSVNRGMKHCDGDVVLLNSDTEVANSFIDKFYYLLTLRNNIGTISSLTNNGTILSLPNYNRSTEFSDKFNVNEYQSLIDKMLPNINISDSKMLLQIPTAIGHCMLITRNLINSIGYFDAETFGKGYGEENDFSQRGRIAGFENYAAMNIFVLHKGSVSFKENRSELVKRHAKIVYKRYPFLKWRTRLFVLSYNPVKKLCKALKNRGSHEFNN